MSVPTLSAWSHFKRQFRLAGFWRKRTTFYRDLAQALEERELPLDFIAGELAIAVSPATQDKARVAGLSYLREVMHSGDLSIHQVLSASMPANDSIALSTLRFTQNIPQALRQLATNVDEQSEMTRMVRSALVSPMILLPVAWVFAYVLATVSIPEFAKSAPDEVWTPFNQLVRSSAQWFQNWGHWVALGLLLMLAWAMFWALPNWTATWRYRMENARAWRRLVWTLVFPLQPLFAIYRDIQGTRMLGNLANLMQSGMLLPDAVNVLRENAQPWMRRHLAIIAEHLYLSPGDYLGAFSHGVLSPFLLGRLGSMVRRDAGGQFDQVLIRLGTTGMQTAREAVKQNALKLNALLLTGVFGLIAFFYGGQNSIAYDMQEANSPSAVMRRQLAKRSAPPPPSPPSATESPNRSAP